MRIAKDKYHNYMNEKKNHSDHLYVVYIHYIKSSNQFIYIGQGKLERAFTIAKTIRNKAYDWFLNDIDQSQIGVMIYANNLSKQESLDLESKLIEKYRNYCYLLNINGATEEDKIGLNEIISEYKITKPKKQLTLK